MSEQEDSGSSWWGFASSALASVQKSAEAIQKTGSDFVTAFKEEHKDELEQAQAQLHSLRVKAQASVTQATEAVSRTTGAVAEAVEEATPVEITDSLHRIGGAAKDASSRFGAAALDATLSIFGVTFPDSPRYRDRNRIPDPTTNARLLALESNSSTYLEDPKHPDFSPGTDTWTEDAGRRAERILVEREQVRAFFEELVPSEVDERRFWLRYFFRVDLLSDEEARARKLAQASQDQANPPAPSPDHAVEIRTETATTSPSPTPAPVSPPVSVEPSPVAVSPTHENGAFVPQPTPAPIPKAEAPTPENESQVSENGPTISEKGPTSTAPVPVSEPEQAQEAPPTTTVAADVTPTPAPDAVADPSGDADLDDWDVWE